jgi:hypothetical protein
VIGSCAHRSSEKIDRLLNGELAAFQGKRVIGEWVPLLEAISLFSSAMILTKFPYRRESFFACVAVKKTSPATGKLLESTVILWI